MGDQQRTRWGDGLLGGACGLSIAAATWTLAFSPALREPGCWAALTVVALIGLLRAGEAVSLVIRWSIVHAVLLLFGGGPALLAHVLIVAPARLRSPQGTSGDRVVLTVLASAAGMASTSIAALVYAASGGSVPFAWSGGAAAALLALVLAHTAVDRAGAWAAVAAGATDRRQPLDWPGWSRALGAHLAGALLGACIAAASGAADRRPWLIILGAVVLAIHAIERKRHAWREVRPVDRCLARIVASGLSLEDRGSLGWSRLQHVALGLGRAAGLPAAELDDLEVATCLHRIDRAAVAAPARGLPAFRRFGRSANAAVDESDVLRALDLPERTAEIVRHRRERWDGGGVPDGLDGLRIPRPSRVLAIAAGFCDLTHPEEGGRPALSDAQALAAIRDVAGRVYDPRLVDVLAGWLRSEGRDVGPQSRSGREAAPSPPTERAAGSSRLVVVQRELHALYEISRSVQLRLELEENLTLILDKLSSLVPFATAAVFLLQEDRHTLRLRFARGHAADRLHALALRACCYPSGRAATERRTLAGLAPGVPGPISDDEWDLDSLRGDQASSALRAGLAAPLVTAGRCLGTLTVYDQGDRRFGPEEKRRLAMVAGYVARAVQSADPASPSYLQSLTDPLTGLPNGRYLEIFASDLSPADVAPEPRGGYGLLGFRVVSLEQVCERHGIGAVERVIGVLARRLAAGCGPEEVPVRYGHDLFLVLTPCTDPAERVRRWGALLREVEGEPIDLGRDEWHRARLGSGHAACPADANGLPGLLDLVESRLNLPADRGRTVVPFRLVRSAG